MVKIAPAGQVWPRMLYIIPPSAHFRQLLGVPAPASAAAGSSSSSGGGTAGDTLLALTLPSVPLT